MWFILLVTAITIAFIVFLLKFRDNIGGYHLTDSNKASSYQELFQKDDENTHSIRKSNAWSVAQKYCDMVTDFYLYGWGRSFHFAPRHAKESFKESICRYEHRLACDLDLKPGMKVLDIGCGVMGPAVEIARFSGANVTGVNLHHYQVKKAKEFIKQSGMENTCQVVQGDFNDLDAAGLTDNSYDAAYAIESTCHGKDRAHVYSQIFKKLKPGAVFGAMEWIMTDKYDPNNEEHNRIKFDIMKGDGLPEILNGKEISEAFKKAGFEIISIKDKGIPNSENPVPWWSPLDNNGWELINWSQRKYGRWIIHKLIGLLETVGLLPESSQKSYEFLRAGADGLLAGGLEGIFTPSYAVIAKKPLH
ncbi:hypothetical protein ABK040_005814 [Willaertia magna]